eukprot:14209176-Alexandrium_andersonii.AAC.1
MLAKSAKAPVRLVTFSPRQTSCPTDSGEDAQPTCKSLAKSWVKPAKAPVGLITFSSWQTN